MSDFNSLEVSINMGGVALEGFGESEAISIEFDNPVTTDKITLDGVTVASKTNDRRATVTVTLMETSPSNAVLTNFYQARQRGTGTIGVVPFSYENTITGEIVVASEAWVQQCPNPSSGSEASERTWEIRLAKAEYAHLGQTA